MSDTYDKKIFGRETLRDVCETFFLLTKTRTSRGIPRRDNARRYQMGFTENFGRKVKKFFQPHLIAIDFVSPRNPAPALGFRLRRKMSHKCLATSQNQIFLSSALLGIPRQSWDSAIFTFDTDTRFHKSSLF